MIEVQILLLGISTPFVGHALSWAEGLFESQQSGVSRSLLFRLRLQRRKDCWGHPRPRQGGFAPGTPTFEYLDVEELRRNR